MSSGKKILLGGIAAILLVGVVIGAVAVVLRTHRSVGDDVSMPAGGAGGASTVSKSIEGICQPTDYKEACVRSLSSALSGNGSAGPKEVIQAAVKVTMDEVQAAFAKSKEIGKGTEDKMQQAAISDCHELLQTAVDELKESLAASNGADDVKTLNSRFDDLKNWLSAVISYQQTCVDGLTHPEIKSSMEGGLVNATQLTSNALAIVTEASKLFQGFEQALLNGQQVPPSRRLLQKSNDDGRYPEWFSASDRRLLRATNQGTVRPNVVVAKDGSGNFKTISAALAAMPKSYKGRYVIYVKAGVYEESVLVDKDMVNVFMYGDGPKLTIVSGHKNFVDGTPTFQTATFAAIGNGFVAKSMGFRNTAGAAKHQAVALRVQSDMSAFFNCRMDGFQDTLYAQTHRQFYRNCVVSGTVDFIFGDAAVILQNCLIIVRRPMDNQQNIVTAHGRADSRETTGLVIHNCRIVPDRLLFPDRFKIATYLGRPWKQYSRTVIMESTLGDFIKPEGWMPWDGDFALKTLYYAEYANRGPGAPTARRVRWPGFKVITNRNEALQFTVGPFIQGNMWLRYTGAPFVLGLLKN